MTEQQKIFESIQNIKEQYGSDLLILGHYYMHPDILKTADILGDSYMLSLKASRTQAKHIIFCGVSFMAESASILCRQDQRVLIPDSHAGCPLADTITEQSFKDCMEKLSTNFGDMPVPVVYVNSSASIKALAGKAGGICCTSSNAALIINSILKSGKRAFFLPDRNLGWNTAKALKLTDEQIGLVTEKKWQSINGQKKLLIWDGYCPIHERFSLQDILDARTQYPHCRILVHPECTPDVVEKADFSGSTSQLLKEAESSKPGSVLFIGTEINFIRRLKQIKTDSSIFPLRESVCTGMGRITLPKLLSTLQNLSQKPCPDEVTVKTDIAENAGEALKRMINIVENHGT